MKGYFFCNIFGDRYEKYAWQASLSANFTVLKIFFKFVFNCLLVIKHC